MKRDIVETLPTGYDADASDDESDADSLEEEAGQVSYRGACCCQWGRCEHHHQHQQLPHHHKGGRPPRMGVGGHHGSGIGMGSAGGTACRWLVGMAYCAFILLAVQRVNHVLTQSNDKHEMAYTIGGAFVVATVPISLYQIFQHLSHFVEPRQQTHVIRMISMVPLYAIQSWFSLRYQNLSLYTQCVREAYESYVIYAFVQYLISYMGSEEQLVMKLQTKPAVLGRHMAPFCCLPPWTMGAEFLHRCKMGVLQYLGVRLATLVLTFVLEYLGLYGEGEYSVRRGFFWVTVVNCVSQTWALYILILFYHATHKELISINPCGKFFSIKSVVFASWWQSLLIGLMVHQGTIGELDSHSAEMVAKGVQDLLICTEMLMAAIAFTFAFPVSDFEDGGAASYLKEPWGSPAHLGESGAGMGMGMGKNGGGGGGGGMMGPGDAAAAALLKGGSGGSDRRGGSHGSGGQPHAPHGGGAMSIWTALWTSCVPMDVREDFKLATQQCLDEDPCICVARCWPCRCKMRCGAYNGHHRPHHSHGHGHGHRHSSAAAASRIIPGRQASGSGASGVVADRGVGGAGVGALGGGADRGAMERDAIGHSHSRGVGLAGASNSSAMSSSLGSMGGAGGNMAGGSGSSGSSSRRSMI